MRRFACTAWPWSLFLAVMVLLMPGCADSSMVLKGQVNKFQQQQVAMSRQNQQLQDRTTSLDKDNQELGSLLAQSRQQSKVFEDQLAAVREQLRSVTTQLTQVKDEKTASERKVEVLTASMHRQGAIAIDPNNSLLQTMPAVNLPGVQVRRDGDVIRVALPGSQLFESGSARLRPGAVEMIRQVGGELYATYAQQIIGVEGHTDSDPVAGRQWRNNHELSVARAMAVYDVLTTQTGYQAGQLFLVGHGPNHPVASNATADGKDRNRRVELVVYPEKRG